MQFEGSITNNVQNAVASAKRLRGQRVYRETIAHWNEVLAEAQSCSVTLDARERDTLEQAIQRLAREISSRSA